MERLCWNLLFAPISIQKVESHFQRIFEIVSFLSPFRFGKREEIYSGQLLLASLNYHRLSFSRTCFLSKLYANYNPEHEWNWVKTFPPPPSKFEIEISLGRAETEGEEIISAETEEMKITRIESERKSWKHLPADLLLLKPHHLTLLAIPGPPSSQYLFEIHLTAWMRFE